MTVATILQIPWLRAALLTLAVGTLTACSEQSATENDAPPPEDPPAEAGSGSSPLATTAPMSQLTPERMAQWSRNCALCHIRGEGGAPVLGDREAWAERRAQGEAVLLEHTVAGLNNMPPLGYCMDCEEDDFLALIRFMGGER